MLKRVCEPINRAAGEALANDLIDTMRAHPGCVGIAAPQVGEPVQVAVVDVRGHRLTTACHGLLILINPVITQRSGHHVAREGCLSLPTITADVGRAERIQVQPGADIMALWSEGFEARAIQHEMDHLQGVLILDRVDSVHSIFIRAAKRSADK
jgi:peptide deformylase